MRPLPHYLLLQRRRHRQLARWRTFSAQFRQVAWVIGFLAVLLVSVAVLFASRLYAGLTSDLPSVSQLPALLNPDDGLLMQPTRLYDRTGQHLLYTLQDPGAERKYLVFDPQKPGHFSPFLIQAAIYVSEPDFWQSSGISWRHLFDPDPVTIAEKLVDRLVLSQETPGLRRSLRMRMLAGQLVSRFGRAQVLEWYLNSAYFGRLAYGAESASRQYLGKSAAELNLGEAAMLAAVLQAPALNPFDAPAAALENQQVLLESFLKSGLVDQPQYETARRFELVLRPPQSGDPSQYPAFINLVLDQLSRRYGRSRVEMGGLQVTTSLDVDLQVQVSCTLQAQLARGEGHSPPAASGCDAVRLLPSLPANFQTIGPDLQGSTAILDLTNGQVLAFTGDFTTLREGKSSVGHAPGTLLTPILAVTAFARGFGPASLVWDIPGQLATSLDTIAHPDGKYAGPISLRRALANDILAPLQQLLIQIGGVNAWQLAEPLGLAGLTQSADPGQLIFSGGSVHLLEAAQAYSTIANLGQLLGQRVQPGARLEPVIVLQVVDNQGRRLVDAVNPESQPVVSAPLAYLVHNVLSDEPARWPSLGYPNLLEIGRPAGAKMGATADGSQTWTAGYTPQRLVVTWMGLPEGNSTAVKLDPRLSAGLWHALIQYANQDLPVANWPEPAGISKMDVCSPSGLLPTQDCPNVVNEVFLIGNEPTGPDTLYRTFQINRESGLLATVFTPPELVEDRTFLVLPEEAQQWGKLAGLPVPPENYDRIQPPIPISGVEITHPAQFGVVHGQVTVSGSAAGAGLSYYQLQVGQGLNPEVWLNVGDRGTTPVEGGTLASWNTGQMNGLYVLRLQVVRQDQHLDTAILQVTVDNTPPLVRILTPLDAQQIAADTRSLTLQAEASDAVGLQKVDFILDGYLLESRGSPPYSLAWTSQTGKHTLKVIATDLAGNTAEDEIQFTVN